MIAIKKVESKKDIKEFVNFPLRLYRDAENFVPPIYNDEIKLLRSGGNTDIAESVFFLAIRDGKTVGRIQGIIQKQYNEIHATKRARFTRFDSIDDTEVSSALFAAFEDWARERGMDTTCGPLGYSDLDREGLLIEGFNENSTYEEQYNYEYYARLLENSGYEKEVDWFEFELRAPDERNEILERVANRALKHHNLHFADRNVSKREYIKKYGDSFFDCLDVCYSKLYGTVPISEAQRRELISQFMMIINLRFAMFICDENERVVAFGLCFPAIGDALKKSGGRLTLPAIIKLLKIAKNPKVVDLGLVAVRPEYQKTGVNAALVNEIVNILVNDGVEKCETNLNLETNDAVMAQWRYFTHRQHKKRRAYVKKIID